MQVSPYCHWVYLYVYLELIKGHLHKKFLILNVYLKKKILNVYLKHR